MRAGCPTSFGPAALAPAFLAVTMLVSMLGCGGRADGDESTDSGTGAEGGSSRGGAAGVVPVDPRPVGTFEQCLCLPDCETPAAEAEEFLCRFANGSLIVKFTFAGCSEVQYSDIFWDFSQTFRLKDNLVTGCTTSSVEGSTRRGAATLSLFCDVQTVTQCMVCPEKADPDLRATYNLPRCE